MIIKVICRNGFDGANTIIILNIIFLKYNTIGNKLDDNLVKSTPPHKELYFMAIFSSYYASIWLF
jgi:hypothetical protein